MLFVFLSLGTYHASFFPSVYFSKQFKLVFFFKNIHLISVYSIQISNLFLNCFNGYYLFILKESAENFAKNCTNTSLFFRALTKLYSFDIYVGVGE